MLHQSVNNEDVSYIRIEAQQTIPEEYLYPLWWNIHSNVAVLWIKMSLNHSITATICWLFDCYCYCWLLIINCHYIK